MQHARPLPRHLASPVAAFVLALFVVGTAAPLALATSDAGAASVGASGTSIQYEEAQRHAADRVRFVTGGTPTVPFQPRAGDPALPAGDLAIGTTNGPRDGMTPQTAVKPGGLRREVFGFLPYWELSDNALRLDYRALSTIAYFGVGAQRDGHLDTTDPDGSSSVGWSGWTSAFMTSLIDNAHANGTRVVLTVQRFAWTSGQTSDTIALLSSAPARQTLANEVAKAVKDRHADGVNLDFEPIPTGQSGNFVSFVRQLRSALTAKGTGYLLTFDATAEVGNYDVANLTAAGAADAVLIMGYDFRGSLSSKAGSIDPLTGPTYDLTDAVNAYLARTSGSKIILGVPYYGRAWSTSGNGPNAPTLSQNSANGYSTSASYDMAATLAATNGRRWDGIEQTPWTAYQKSNCSSCAAVWRELYYDDAPSLGLRYDLINRKGLRGAGIWALGYDGTRPELYAVLKAKFVNDTTPPQAGVVRLPQSVADEGFTVAWTGLDDFTGVAWFDVQVSIDRGPWTAWLTHTTANSATWLGQQGHGYAFRVHAADGHGNVGGYAIADAYVANPSLTPGSFALVLADGLNVRAAPGQAAPVVMQASAGTLARILAGPVQVGGLDWFQVALPITSWPQIGDQQVGVWVAAGSGGTAYIAPARPPNSTLVQAAISGLGFGGAGQASLGPGGAGYRDFSPNGDGRGDTLSIDWTNARTFGSMTLDVYRGDGSYVGPIALGSRAVGSQHYTWNGAVGATYQPSGIYLVRLDGTDGSGTYHAPAAAPVDPAQVARFGIALHRIGIERLAGADRYATAAAISAASFAPGAPVAYVASGAAPYDALAAAPAAAKRGGPILLVTGTAIPASTAAELRRLRPAQIVVVGGVGAVSDAVKRALGGYVTGAVTRLAGSDRVGTAAAVSAVSFMPGVPVAYVVTASGYADGLAAAGAAAHGHNPLLLTAPGSLSAATRAELARLRPSRIVLVGGSGAISEAVKVALAPYAVGGVTRLAGPDRYATAAALSAATYASAQALYLATGTTFPDALAIAPLGGPLLLLPGGAAVPATVRAEAARLGVVRLVPVGGIGAVSPAQVESLRATLGG